MNFETLQPYIQKRQALESALTLISFDLETNAPKNAIENTSQIYGTLSNELFQTINNEEVKSILKQLTNESLTQAQKAIVRDWKKDIERIEKVPADQYQAHQELIMNAQHIWQSAKKENNYQMFMPYLKKLVEEEKAMATYRHPNNIYECLLQDYEPDFSIEQLDTFFQQLKDEIVPLIHDIQNSSYQIDKAYNYRTYDIEKQKAFNLEIAKYIGFDFDKGIIRESEHPFTDNLHNKDVRITTHYYPNSLESALFSTIHETGHAIYEFNIDDEITLTPIGAGTSMGMHESQSRFYENIIGRSPLFWKPLYPKLQDTFSPTLDDISFEHFIEGINKVEASLIRTEADELTYPLHIMIRYELEKKLFNEDIDFKQLPQLWNQMYQDYLGVIPSSDTEGILQDVHWAGGLFGYFPSYAIGSAVGAQIYAYMQKHTNIDEWIATGNFQALKDYLKEHLHRYGTIYTTNELLKNLTGETFNPQYYIDYLKTKYKALYHLK